MWQVYLIMFIAVVIISVLWVSGITNMHEKYPDYKGEEFTGFDFDDDISDWDVTLMDGLEEEDEFKRDYEED